MAPRVSQTISVVIPAYNASKYVAVALGSIYGQTRLPLEIIVVDHASTDDTAAITRRLASEAPIAVRLIQLPRNSGGPASALNAGVQAAVGDLIATLDHDDQMLPEKIAAQAECLERWPGAAMCIGRCIEWPEGAARRAGVRRANAILAQMPAKETEGWARLIDKQTAYESFALNDCYALTCSNIVFRKSAWEVAGGFDEKNLTSPDLDLLGKLTSKYDLAIVDMELVRWTAPTGSHYEAASALRLLRDMLRVYHHVDRQLLPPGILRKYDQRVGQEVLDTAYALRQAGAYRKSAGLYFKALHLPTARWRGALGLTKLLPHGALRGFRPKSQQSGRRLFDAKTN